MAESQTDKELIEALKTRGDARNDGGWATGDPDYVAEYRLAPKHVPALISIAIQWGDEPPENNAVSGPIHAWRALGDWKTVREVFGVPGLGMAPDHAPGWTARGQGYGPSVAVHGLGRSDREKRKQIAAKRQAKAKRKQQKKDRKRNRWPR